MHLEQEVFEIGFGFCKFSVSLCYPYSTIGLLFNFGYI